MKLFRKYMLFFLSIAVLAATTTPSMYAVKREKKEKSFFIKIKKSFKRFVTGQWKQMSGNDWIRVIGTSVLTSLSSYSFYWMFFKKSIVEEQHPRTPAANHPRINNRPVFYNNRLNAAVTLRQVPVPSQRGSSCAYHALLNGIKVVNALHANADEIENLAHVLINNQSQHLINERIRREVKEQIDDQERITPTGFWRQLIINSRQAHNQRDREWNASNRERIKQGETKSRPMRSTDGENLRSNEIEQLIAFEQSNDERRLLAQNIQIGFTAYDSILEIGNSDIDVYSPQVREALENNNSYFHVFLIRSGDSNFGNGGHWYTLVLHKTENGQHHYITMDSFGANNGWFDVTQDQGIIRIIRAIEGQEVLNVMQPKIQEQPKKTATHKSTMINNKN